MYEYFFGDDETDEEDEIEFEKEAQIEIEKENDIIVGPVCLNRPASRDEDLKPFIDRATGLPQIQYAFVSDIAIRALHDCEKKLIIFERKFDKEQI